MPSQARSRSPTTACCSSTARFQLVAAMNPCRCGHAFDPGMPCRRQPVERCIAQYASRLSGPLLDRIDLHIDVPAVTAADLILPPPTEDSAAVAARVLAARRLQWVRYEAQGLPSATTNASAAPAAIEAHAKLDETATSFLRTAADRMRLTARGFHRVLRLARTLADLDGAPAIGCAHLAEAFSYRKATAQTPAAA